jgi:predicted GIY-YIG superfamily endonuclease
MKYDKGKIYKIIDNTNGNIYIGSTIQPLYKRLSQHKYPNSNHCMSKYIIDNGNYDIILIENHPCNSKEELEKRERYYIENTDCINKMTPGKTHKEWYQENRERILIKMKNKVKTDERKQYEIDYSIKNKDIINQKTKLWYQK